MKEFIEKNQKNILIVLLAVFVLLSLAAFWDLYGKDHICIGKCDVARSSAETTTVPDATSRAPIDDTTRPAKPVKPGNKAQKPKVDESLFAACTQNATENKACKDCCDALQQDVSVIQACKKACNTIQ